MQTAATFDFLRYSALWRLVGPIFTTELRVASRRRRSYVLRFAYVCCLGLFIVQVWLATVRSGGAGVVGVSRMAEAGKNIAVTVIWFQFIACQILAAALLSGAINGEIRRRTLDALLVTPISGGQIVLGKFLNRLLQLGVVVASGVPLLVLALVFGGVPRDFIISGLCITASTAAFTAALSLLLSAVHRQAHQAVATLLLICLLLYGGVAGMAALLQWRGLIGSAAATRTVLLANPFFAMLNQTREMLAARAGVAGFSWPLHCLLLLAAAAGILLLSVRRMRRVSLRLATGDAAPRAADADLGDDAAQGAGRPGLGRRRRLRPVTGSPIVWKELRRPWLFRSRWNVLAQVLLVVIGCAVVALPAAFGAPPAVGLHVLIGVCYLLFMVRVATSAAGAIASEKEARTWLTLLATPLEDREIVWGKGVAAFRRGLFLLAPIPVLHVVALMLGGQRESILPALMQMGFVLLGLLGTAAFLIGMGLYFSAVFQTVAAAVALTLGVYVGMQFFCCGGLTLFPLMLATTAMTARMGGGPSAGAWLMSMAMAALPALVHTAMGLCFMRAATRRLRRRVF